MGHYGVIKHTTDRGSSWITQTNPDPDNRTLNKVFFLDSDIGWAVGYHGTIFHTINGGCTWVLEGIGLTIESFYGVHFTSPTIGYVVGTRKTLLKHGELTPVGKVEKQQTQFTLLQNYPNPFNPTTKIKFTIPTSPLNPSPYQGEGQRERLITLKIYDILGNEVATLVNEEKPAGSYEINFKGNGLTSGVYFYQLKVGSFLQVKKMILLK